MTTLETEFTKLKVTYRQVKRDGELAVYSYSAPGEPDKIRGYEMIVIQSHDDYELHGNKVAAGESYPGTTSWGRAGWSFNKLNSALDKMAQVKETRQVNSEARAKREAAKDAPL